MKFKVTGMDADDESNIDNNGNVLGAKGGTEMMREGLLSRLNPSLSDKFNIISSRVRDLSDNKKNVLWLHDTWDDPESQHLKEKESRDRFDKLVFVSNYQFQTYHLAHGIDYREAVVLKNAIEPIPDYEKDKGDKINFIYHTTPHRGLELLVPSFKALYDHYGDMLHLDVYSSFNIYGWPQRDEPYQKVFDMCDEHPGITNHGTVPNDEIRKALQKAHIFAYPNIWPETSCIALMEAMSARCAIVTNNHAALAETSANFANMYQMDEDPNRHAQSFVNMCDAVIKDFWNERHEAKLNFQKIYADNFYSWGGRIPEWEGMLNSLLQK
tara:strand:- start:7931 stop:8908 length:978 start_codon:yes stop_codon:yes gene_type:complete